ncbi:FMN-dependent NADH-azoreductase [Inquilinus sp. CA228]|uniref:FMN-dependent NADH-azoreductase n=1 Tax=Inquilinus sp. CA228 TaxID=3455609 RepID=UPI003F8D09C3
MTTILHIDSSARLGRSHSRRLSARFVEAWLARRPGDMVIRRDVGLEPPPPVTEAWIAAAFTKPDRRTPEMRATLALSDALVDELERADLIVAGVPMYNFGLPAPMKAWVDNIVRVGRTFGFDRSRQGEPYWPMLSGKRLVTLGARGDWGYDPGGRLAGLNHVEPHLHTVFRYIGIPDAVSVAAEYDEFADERVERSLQAAEAEIDRLVARITAEAQAA